MTAYTGTTIEKGRTGGLNQQFIAKASFDLADGGAGLANADTITWAGILPYGKKKIVGFKVYGQEIDVNAAPTATFTIGDGTDADGFLTTKGGAVGLQSSLAGQLVYFGDGALLDDATFTGTDVVLTVTAPVEETAITGKLFIELLVEGV